MKGIKKPPRRAPDTVGSKTAGSRRARRSSNTQLDASGLLRLVKLSLDDDQADEVVVIDLAGKTAMADFMVICSGRNRRHIGAMAEHLKGKIKGAGLPSPPMEGLAQADWVLIDGGDVIVHLFRPEARALYNLEKMWGGVWSDPNTVVEDESAGDIPPEKAET